MSSGISLTPLGSRSPKPSSRSASPVRDSNNTLSVEASKNSASTGGSLGRSSFSRFRSLSNTNNSDRPNTVGKGHSPSNSEVIPKDIEPPQHVRAASDPMISPLPHGNTITSVLMVDSSSNAKGDLSPLTEASPIKLASKTLASTTQLDNQYAVGEQASPNSVASNPSIIVPPASLGKSAINTLSKIPTTNNSGGQDDFLVEDFSCALQKEILVQGRMYISEKHINFHANIFGWVTNISIPFTDIIAVSKKMTAFVIPNAVEVATKERKYFFTSFLMRDTAYSVIVDTWKRERAVEAAIATVNGTDPSAVENLVSLIETSTCVKLSIYDDGNTSRSINPDQSYINDNSLIPECNDEESSGSVSESDLDIMHHLSLESGDSGAGKSSTKPEIFVRRPTVDSSKQEKLIGKSSFSDYEKQSGKESFAPSPAKSKRPSTAMATNSSLNLVALKQEEEEDTAGPTECDCLIGGIHSQENIISDVVFPCSLKRMNEVLFGDDKSFLQNFLENIVKCREVKIGPWQVDVEGKTSRSLDYIMPLNNTLGPRQAHTFVTEVIQSRDLNHHITVFSEGKTPEVPYGGAFSVKNKFCLMKTGNKNETRMLISSKCEFTKSVFLKNPIERAALDGNAGYYLQFSAELKQILAPAPLKAPGKATRRRKTPRPTTPSNLEKPLPPAPALNTKYDATALWRTLNISPFSGQLIVVTLLIFCIITNIWFWFAISELKQLQPNFATVPDNSEEFLLTDNQQFWHLDMESRQKIQDSVGRLRELDKRVEQMASAMNSAEQELALLFEELEVERGKLNEAFLEGVKMSVKQRVSDISRKILSLHGHGENRKTASNSKPEGEL